MGTHRPALICPSFSGSNCVLHGRLIDARCPTAFFMFPVLTYFLFNKKSLYFLLVLSNKLEPFCWTVLLFSSAGQFCWAVRRWECAAVSFVVSQIAFPKPYLLVMRFSLLRFFRRYLSSALGQCIRLRCAIVICLLRILITHLAVSRSSKCLFGLFFVPYSKGCYYLVRPRGSGPTHMSVRKRRPQKLDHWNPVTSCRASIGSAR